jgi:hypothetical protein
LDVDIRIYELHQYMDGNGGNTVCNPNYQVSNNFEPATRWARSNNVYAPSSSLSPSYFRRRAAQHSLANDRDV